MNRLEVVLSIVGIVNFFVLVWFFVIITDIRCELRILNKNAETTNQILANMKSFENDEIIDGQELTIKVSKNGKYKVLPSHVDCPECGASANATPCPNCGYPIELESEGK